MKYAKTKTENRVLARLWHAHSSPRKARLVADLIRYMMVNEAIAQLEVLPKRAGESFRNLLLSARKNAQNNFHLDPETLYISRILVHGGPVLKRWLPRARGSASPLMKRTSHIVIELRPASEGLRVKRLRRAGFVAKDMGEQTWEKREEIAEEAPGEKKASLPRFRSAEQEKPKRMERFIPRIFRRKSV